MNRINNFEIGDYVRYTPHFVNVQSPVDNGLGFVNRIDTPLDKERYELKLFKNRIEKIWCDIGDLNHIVTKKEILLDIGFVNLDKNNPDIFYKNNIGFIRFRYLRIINNITYLFDIFDETNSLSNLTNPDIINKYLIKNEFDFKKFDIDYPSITNINNLFKLLKKYEDDKDEEYYTDLILKNYKYLLK